MAVVAGVARVDRRVVGDEQGDACGRGQHPTDDQNGGGRELTVEIVGRHNTREAGYPLVALISSNRLCSFKRLIKHVSQVGFIAIIRNSVKRFKSMPLKYYKLRKREA